MVDNLPKIVYLDVVGCPENRFDVQQLKSFLEQHEIRITSNPAEADTLIINTCGLTGRNEKLSQEIIEKTQKHASPGARLIISGCLPKINPEALRSFTDALLIPGPLLDSLPWDLNGSNTKEEEFSPLLHPQRQILERENIWNLKKNPLWILDRLMYQWTGITPPGQRRFFIKIATGCNHRCTFCAVRISRGDLRSQPFEWIVDRVRDGISAGFRDINLIGTNVSAYGIDIGSSLPALLRNLLQINPEFRIHLRNLEPEDVLRHLPEFCEILETGRIPYLEIPLQSGSNRLLKLMNRRYTVEEYTNMLIQIKKAYPRIHIRSQVMVGFPTETEDEFKETVKLAAHLPFLYVETFRFSPRPETAASRLDGQIPNKIAKARYHALQRRLVRAQLKNKTRFALEYILGKYKNN